MAEKTNVDLYLIILGAFALSYLIFSFIVGSPVSNFVFYYLFFFIPAFIISAIIVLVLIYSLNKTKFRKSINRKNISFLSIIIVIITIVLAVIANIFISSQYSSANDLIGKWELDEEHKPLIGYVDKNQNDSFEINNLRIWTDQTYGWHIISFEGDSIYIDFMFDYDKSSKEITLTDAFSSDDWKLTIKLDIYEAGTASTMTMHYVSGVSFPHINSTSLDGLTWTKIT